MIGWLIIHIIQECRSYFEVELPSCLITKKQDKFLSRYNCVENLFRRYCSKLWFFLCCCAANCFFFFRLYNFICLPLLMVNKVDHNGEMLRRLFNIMQVYSQLTFDCSANAANESSVLFKQELKDANNGELLLDDVESIDCRSVQTCMWLAIFTWTRTETKIVCRRRTE